MPKLSDTQIRAAVRAAIKSGTGRKLYDELGLYLQLTPNKDKCGSWWRQRYDWMGKEKLLSVGVYPAISLSSARAKRDAIRAQVANGVDPSSDRKERKVAELGAAATTFEAVARDWHAKFKSQWSPEHAERILTRLDDNLFAWIGSKPIAAVTAADFLNCLDRMSQRGAFDTARRTLQTSKKIFKWAVGRKFIATSPIAHIEPRDELPKRKVKHRAAIKDPAQFGALLRAIDTYPGGFVVKCALKLVALTFVRSSELREARWPEFQLEGKEPTWRIPPEKMKMEGEPHIVPLSRQAVAVLRELQPLTGADGVGLVFPSVRNASRPLSENTLNAALRTMGFTQQQHTTHGFRSTASTMLNEQQWNKDAIELQLAHMERDETRESYNSATLLPVRRQMMQGWADHMDDLKGAFPIADVGSIDV